MIQDALLTLRLEVYPPMGAKRPGIGSTQEKITLGSTLCIVDCQMLEYNLENGMAHMGRPGPHWKHILVLNSLELDCRIMI